MSRWHLVFGAIRSTRDLPKKDAVSDQSQPKTVEMWGFSPVECMSYTVCPGF